MNFIYRLACIDDLNDLSEIVKLSNIEPSGGMELELKREIFGNSSDEAPGKLFIVRYGHEIIGYARLIYYSPVSMTVDHISPEGWYTNGVFVREDMRHRGVALSLLALRKNYINTSIRGTLDLFSIVATDNTPSMEYHKKAGFIEKTSLSQTA